MRRFWVGLALLACTACKAPQASTTPTPVPATPKPTHTLPPVAAGGTVAMGRTVITHTGSKVTVLGWHLHANRSIPNGPGQVYETVNVSFCAGPQVQESGADLAPDFNLVLYNGNSVIPDSQSQAGEFRTKGTINPGQCVSGPLVFQVEGGEKPHYVRFATTTQTKWTVP